MLTSDIDLTESYSSVIESALKCVEKISRIGIDIPKESWIHDAIKHAKKTEHHRIIGRLEEFTSDSGIRWKTTIVFGSLSEFNFILSQIDKLSLQSKDIVQKKLKEIIKMPLKVIDEDAKIGTNQGRNTLFELRLASRFTQAGYNTILFSDHPDILISTKGSEYAIECKRVFSVRSFKKLTKEAINQLTNYSLKKQTKRFGIVAISITRAFHVGDKKLYADSHDLLGKSADREIEKFLREYAPFIQNIFPTNIPALILDFSDLGESVRPYWIHWIYLIGTAKNPQDILVRKIQDDLKSFLHPNL